MRALRDGWERFWFTPTSTAPVELFRIVFGVLATAWTLTLVTQLQPFFGVGAAIPARPDPGPGGWTAFALVGGSWLIWPFWALGLVASVALTVGYRSRWAALAVFVLMTSVTRQAPSAFNAGDGLLRILSLYVLLMPVGSAASLDRRRTDPGRTWDFPLRAPWALRLVQIQVSVIYLATIWEKSGGALWRNGSAVSFALRIGDLTRAGAPTLVTDSPVLTQLTTYSTLGLEAALGILVWNRAARPVVLWLGVLLHLSIDVSLAVGFFSFAMITSYLAFVPAARAETVLCGGRDRVAAALRPRAGGTASSSGARARASAWARRRSRPCRR